MQLRVLVWSAVLALVLTAACQPRSPAPPPAAAPAESEPPVAATARLTGGRLTLVDEESVPLWEVHFAEITMAQTDQEMTSSMRESRGRSLRPGVDTTLQADRLAWDNAGKRLALEGVKVSSAQEEASFQVAQAHWTLADESFTTDSPVTFRRGGIQAQGKRLTADTALRTARLAQVTAQAQAGGKTVWTATADAAAVAREKATLTQTRGRLTEGSSPLTFTAPRATWHPAKQVLALTGDLRAEQGGAVVTTSGLNWNRREGRWTGTRPLTFQRGGLRIVGRGFTAPTDLRTARITAARATLASGRATAEVQGQAAELTSTGSLVLRQARATLERGGRTVVVTAPQARWDPAAQTLHLAGGVRAVEGRRTARLAAATWSARTEQFVGTGQVSVQEGTATLSGERLEADTGLQTVSLTPARLTFRDPARKQTWTARAERASRQADGTLGLKHVAGTVTDAVGPVELTADGLRWKPPDPVVTATGRVHLQSEAHDFRLKANRIEWNRDTQRITASGQVEWASNLLAPDPSKCSGNVVVYDLVTKELKVR